MTEFDFRIYSINLSIYICYYLKIPKEDLREKLISKLNTIFKYRDFLEIPKIEQKFIVDNMDIPKEIEINNNLLENIFSLFFAINTRTPLFIVEKTDKKKSISFELIYKSMKGSWSKNNLFKLYPKILLYTYNNLIDKEYPEIKEILSKANILFDKFNNEEKRKYCSIIYYNEMEIKNSLNLLNYNFEFNEESNNITFVVISNIFNYKIEQSKFLYIINPQI